LLSGFSNGPNTQQIWLDEVRCTGNENRLLDCPASPIGIQNCQHIDDVGVNCIRCPSNGAVRLQAGSANNEGRVEVCNGNAWGTICADQFGPTDAQVVCRSLNQPFQGLLKYIMSVLVVKIEPVTNSFIYNTHNHTIVCPISCQIFDNGCTAKIIFKVLLSLLLKAE